MTLIPVRGGPGAHAQTVMEAQLTERQFVKPPPLPRAGLNFPRLLDEEDAGISERRGVKERHFWGLSS